VNKIKTILRRQIKAKILEVHNKLMMVRGNPYNFTYKVINILKFIFSSFNGKKNKIFEWGSGNSTIYFAQFLKSINIDFEWHSVDNSKKWSEFVARRLKDDLKRHVLLYTAEFLPYWEKPEWNRNNPACQGFGPNTEQEFKYINQAKSLNQLFDVIIVDGRFRRRCLLQAIELLSREGVVLLHDAERSYYRDVLSAYPFKKFIYSECKFLEFETPSVLWIGSKNNKSLITRLKEIG